MLSHGVFYLHGRQCVDFACALFLSRDSVWHLPRACRSHVNWNTPKEPGEASASSSLDLTTDLAPPRSRLSPASRNETNG